MEFPGVTVCQCLNGFLNAYLDKCLDIISCVDEFVIYHVPREENPRANALAQQASGYNVRKKKFSRSQTVAYSRLFCSGSTGRVNAADRSDRRQQSDRCRRPV
jgi:hypothetical protein